MAPQLPEPAEEGRLSVGAHVTARALPEAVGVALGVRERQRRRQHVEEEAGDEGGAQRERVPDASVLVAEEGAAERRLLQRGRRLVERGDGVGDQ